MTWAILDLHNQLHVLSSNPYHQHLSTFSLALVYWHHCPGIDLAWAFTPFVAVMLLLLPINYPSTATPTSNLSIFSVYSRTLLLLL